MEKAIKKHIISVSFRLNILPLLNQETICNILLAQSCITERHQHFQNTDDKAIVAERSVNKQFYMSVTNGSFIKGP